MPLLKLQTQQKAGLRRPSFVDGKVRVTLTSYFLGAIESFAALATRNFTTVFALI